MIYRTRTSYTSSVNSHLLCTFIHLPYTFIYVHRTFRYTQLHTRASPPLLLLGLLAQQLIDDALVAYLRDVRVAVVKLPEDVDLRSPESNGGLGILGSNNELDPGAHPVLLCLFLPATAAIMNTYELGLSLQSEHERLNLNTGDIFESNNLESAKGVRFN
ncbi:hypothetical protein K438DRAFT_1969033 [Mycena galopus ATCC 62051]|nr:hypothetical protein K438DRAFT_1969033 [Mycena galopus ATCC 62051]